MECDLSLRKQNKKYKWGSSTFRLRSVIVTFSLILIASQSIRRMILFLDLVVVSENKTKNTNGVQVHLGFVQ